MSDAVSEKDITVLAVPCNKVVILSKKQGDELREKMNKRRAIRKKERELVAQRVKLMIGKPGKK